MDHLLDHATDEMVTIPYRCKEMYDGGDFDTYPSRAGWELAALRRGDFQDKSKEDAIGFLQSWLYYGILWEYFGGFADFTLTKFVRQTEYEKKVVSTQNLAQYIVRWSHLEEARSVEQRHAGFVKTLTRLRFVYDLAITLSNGFPTITLDKYKRPPWQLPDDISLSIQVLADTLQHAGFKIYKERYNLDWGYSPLLKQKMLTDGWCPRAVSTCLFGQHIHILCYASTVRPPSLAKNHRECSEMRCEWEHIPMNSYKTKHRPSCSGDCRWDGPNEDELIKIYRDKKSPLLRLYKESVQVVGTDYSDGYIALSHVCKYHIHAVGVTDFVGGADGLGNQTTNTLPLCQLQYIQRLMDSFQKRTNEGQQPLNIFWWCDTLCVPVREQFVEHRKAAIRDMRLTYASASKTLILDAELMCSSIHDSPVELFIRLKLSSWARRLWTFQESNLSRDAYIQLADGVMGLKQLHQALGQDAMRDHRSLYTRYWFIAQTLIPPLLMTEERENLPQPNLLDIWKQIEWRGTSRQSDESICLANLMRADPSSIMAIDYLDLHGRMAKFFSLIRIVPLSLLFQAPPRNAMLGFHWAPASLLECFRDAPGAPFRLVNQCGFIGKDARGLVLRKSPGVVLADESVSSFRWTGAPFTLDVGQGSLLNAIYRAIPAYKADRDIIQATGDRRTGNPVLLLLLPASRYGTIACILAESIGQGASDGETLPMIDFVGIVTIDKVDNTTANEAAYAATEIPPKPWLLC